MRATTRVPWPRLASALAGVALVTAGCGGGSGSASEVPEDTTAPSAEDSTAADSPTIRDVDFTTVEWREQVSEQHVTPVADPGDADPMAGPIVTVGEAVYVDVDDDGDEDAIAPLIIEDGNSLSEIYYIWTWDAEAEKPVQVENPIARAHDCGAVVEKVTADPASHAFVINEHLRRPGAEGVCADKPTLKAERSVTLVDGWPVLATGIGGHGGICPQPRGHDNTWPVEDTALLAGPRASIGEVQDPQLNWFAEADISGHRWLYREGWLLVNFGPYVGDGRDTHFKEYGDYTPCAWIEVDPARQSDLGMLPAS